MTDIILEQYLGRFSPYFREVLCKDSKFLQKYYSLLLRQGQKWFASKTNPFRLCPDTVVFWFFVRPYCAIGLAIRDLRNVQILWRQQMEPNETIYLLFKVIEIWPPYSLTLLATYASLALVIIDAAYRIFEVIGLKNEQKSMKTDMDTNNLSYEPAELEEIIKQEVINEHSSSCSSYLDPFSLTPRMSIYFPVYDHHTSIGFLTIDFRHVELSIKQSLEPSDNIVSLIRFFDLYSPFPLQIAVMILSFGLFLNGAIYKLEQLK
ncbi:hypothetical protein Desaci_2466 [Desulfosporosinus acidiphilus SJ4]|uniref:Uncharacterized protein n=2 Tax=Desulfosporosinus TaxID=79206 RepID=I4D6J0_DESAJ|nr:hypothetical protein Desaci_2466 [Desulfosporosinus acidiphilus SJ4]